MPAATRLRKAKEFLAWYVRELPVLRDAARQLEEYLQRTVADANVSVHAVSARAKSADSVATKVLMKAYANPKARVTDRIGARVILYDAREIDRVAVLLRSLLDVRERDSTDKRRALGLREFGYRSYHLVGSLPQKDAGRPELRALRGQVFEIQIRSLLEHAWAEIEHGAVYKAGANLPDDIKRRFAAAAGMLELLEHEFQELGAAKSQLIETATRGLNMRGSAALDLDVPYALATLERHYPTGRSFRQAAADRAPFPPGIEQRFVLALKLVGIGTVGSLARALGSDALRRLRQRYALAEGISVGDVSHLALLALVLASRSRAVVEVYFPEFNSDLSLRHALSSA